MDKISKFSDIGVRDGIQTETAKLARTISQIESIFTNIKRGVQNIDAQKVVQVAGKLKAYSLEWTKLHDEYTALVHESQLSANRVKSKIQYLLDIIKGYGQDHQGLHTHLSTYINGLKGFQDETILIETRFHRLSQDVDAFRRNLQQDVAAQMDPTSKLKLEGIDLKIQGLQAELFNASQLFVKSWETMKERKLEDRQCVPPSTFLATAGIAALAPYTAAINLRSDLESLGFSIDKALKSRGRQQALKEELKECQGQRKALTSGVPKLDTLKHIEAIVGGLGLDDIFEDTIARLYTVRGIWHALCIDALTLQSELGKPSNSNSGTGEAHQKMISHFKNLYDTLWFALLTYTSEVAKTEQSRVHDPSMIAGVKRDSKRGFIRRWW